MKNVNNFQQFSLRVLLSICLSFCRFQPGVAYRSVAYKKRRVAELRVNEWFHNYPSFFYRHERRNSCKCINLLTVFITNFIYMLIETEFTVNFNV